VSFGRKRDTRTAASAHTGTELEIDGTSIATILWMGMPATAALLQTKSKLKE